MGSGESDDKAVLRRHRPPPWFEDAKLGIFVHWGLYSVPGWAPPLEGDGPAFAQITDAMAAGRMPYAEWYLNSLRTPGSATQAYHRSHYGDTPYEAFREPFLAMLDTWDPDSWAEMFAAAGARYVVLTTKHADGFLLWPSSTPHPDKSGWQLERDVVGELGEAVRARGLRFGLYYCGGMDWSFQSRPVVDLASVYSTVPASATYRAYVESHLRELVDRYRPSVLWNDIALPPGFPRDRVLVDYLDRVPDGVINDRLRVVPAAVMRGLDRRPLRWVANSLGRRAAAGGGLAGSVPYFADYATPEYTAEPDVRSHKWETCRGFGHSFGYNRAEEDEHLLSAGEVVRSLIDVSAKNGNLLLNVGPRGEDGVVPDAQVQRLKALGEWLATGGEAVYGTRPWTRAQDRTAAGEEVRFTQADGSLYVTVMGNPEPGTLVIDGVPTPGPVELLGHGPLPRLADQRSLRVTWPSDLPPGPAPVLRVAPQL